MKTIIIVGFGNIGKRYYESLLSLNNNDICIYIYDPNIQINNNNVVNTLILNKEIDLAIISTCSDVRFDVTCELIKNNIIKYILFEKFLFLKKNQYIEMKNILDINNIKAWVNCTRRFYNYYKTIKETLKNDNNISFTVFGGGWQLCCNSIHYIDLYCFITEKKIQNLKITNTKIMESKRKNFLDMTGNLCAENLNIICFDQKLENIYKKISGTNYDFIIINKNTNVLIIKYDKINDNIDVASEKIPLLSEIAKYVVTDIIYKGDVSLPTFDDSVDNHLLLLDLFEKEFTKQNCNTLFT